jgi:hypothetical protein
MGSGCGSSSRGADTPGGTAMLDTHFFAGQGGMGTGRIGFATGCSVALGCDCSTGLAGAEAASGTGAAR